MTEKKRRAPGGGRKKKPESERTHPHTVWLTDEQTTYCKKHGELSKFIRALIDRERGEG